jgi:hypothetical protein
LLNIYIDKYSKAEKSHIFTNEKHCMEYKIVLEILHHIKAFLVLSWHCFERSDVSD